MASLHVFGLHRLLPVEFFQFLVLHTTVHLERRERAKNMTTRQTIIAYYYCTFRWLNSDVLKRLFVCHWQYNSLHQLWGVSAGE